MPLTSVAIVGGGTAGWLTAGVISARWPGLQVTLVESPSARPIGVGEGTWPTIRETLRRMGVREADLMRHCDAAFKQGSRFIGWGNGGEAYYHPFTSPQGYSQVDLAPAWLEASEGASFADYVSFQPALCEAGLAPRLAETPEYAGLANYAYHLDAAKLGEFLKAHCTRQLGVRYVRADVSGVIATDNGLIEALLCADDHPNISADLFIDCTGFASRLIGGHYGVALKSCADTLMIDTALALQVPCVAPDAPVSCVTLSTAQSAGWIWDIGLPHRRGVGHVYASAFTSESEAVADVLAYAERGGGKMNEGDIRRIPIVAGYRERPWVGNCVAVGLSMGFVEPLEASSIVMVELAARMIADQMPAEHSDMADVAGRFNALFSYRWARVVDFLKLHYVLGQRDEPFWRASRDPAGLPDSLRGLLEIWRHRPPWHGDFVQREEIFSEASHQYVLYGGGFRSNIPVWRREAADRTAIDIHRREVAAARRALLSRLEPHRVALARYQSSE